ncbi:MAG: hypothetical protein HY654_10995, partial [Acidobacteria bacterium]|nr:hypothetical protein [Acidobacteriota bacterium]
MAVRLEGVQAAVPDRVLDYLDQAAIGRDVTKVLPLTGDASDRRYFRAIRPGH